jgi:hypothetical protein
MPVIDLTFTAAERCLQQSNQLNRQAIGVRENFAEVVQSTIREQYQLWKDRSAVAEANWQAIMAGK